MPVQNKAPRPTPHPHAGVLCNHTLIVSLPQNLVNVVTCKELLSSLFKLVDVKYLKCVQSMPNGIFRASFCDIVSKDFVLQRGISVRGVLCNVFEADPARVTLRLFRCPFEV